VIDDADKAVLNDERAMELFQQSRQRYEAPVEAWTRRSEEIHCVDCGEPIPAQRLAAMPRTVRCMPCASDVERR
jgi:RNA polymerase-binding transcription factor DksA